MLECPLFEMTPIKLEINPITNPVIKFFFPVFIAKVANFEKQNQYHIQMAAKFSIQITDSKRRSDRYYE